LAAAPPPVTSPIVAEVAPVPKSAAPVVGTLRQLPQAAPATVPPAVTGGPARPTLTPDPASLAQLPPAAASGAPGGVHAASSALPPSAPSPLIEQLQASLQQGRTPAPVTGQVTPALAEGPLQMPTADLADPMTQSRVGVGAERVARQTGKTIEQVREETGSLPGEELGTRSATFPHRAFSPLS